MNLTDFGYSDKLEEFRLEQHLEEYEPGRIVAEHRERYVVITAREETEAEITGNMRFTASGRLDFPVVGDWVVLAAYDSGIAIIHKILPRFSLITRQSAGQSGEIQAIAANVDAAFIVQAVDRDFNINRLERYLTICHSSKVIPVIVLTKTDLVNEVRVSELTDLVASRIVQVPVIALSNKTRTGYVRLTGMLERGKTYCLLGSSGAGKSTLLNNLSGGDRMKTGSISTSTDKGKHITSHRELVFLENGGMLIDNPGMREVGIADEANGLETTFYAIGALAEECKFGNCTHTGEVGCRVIEAVKKGELDRKTYENYLKMEREKAHFESTVAERRKKDRDFGKMIREYKKSNMKRK